MLLKTSASAVIACFTIRGTGYRFAQLSSYTLFQMFEHFLFGIESKSSYLSIALSEATTSSTNFRSSNLFCSEFLPHYLSLLPASNPFLAALIKKSALFRSFLSMNSHIFIFLDLFAIFNPIEVEVSCSIHDEPVANSVIRSPLKRTKLRYLLPE